EVFLEVLDGLIGQPVIELLEGLLAGVDLAPRDLPLAAVGLGDRRVENANARAPDVSTRTITLDERDDRVIGNVELVGATHRNGLTVIRCGHSDPPERASRLPQRSLRNPGSVAP